MLGLRQKTFTQQSLLAKIRATGYNSLPNNDWGGFVCLTGGRETEQEDGVLRGSFGFCHQRSAHNLDQVGQFTKFQARLQQGGRKAGREDLERLLRQPRTVVKTSFPEEDGEVVTIDYLRFLLDERKLSGFRLRHLIFYRVRRYRLDVSEMGDNRGCICADQALPRPLRHGHDPEASLAPEGAQLEAPLALAKVVGQWAVRVS